MADNITINGKVIATDEISSTHYQRLKVTFGADGTAGDVHSSNPLPVRLFGTQPDVVLAAGSALVGSVDINEFPASSRETDTVGAAIDVLSMAANLAEVTVKFASISASSSGYTSLVAAVSGKKIRVLSYALVAASAVTAQFASASNARSGVMSLAANGGISAQAINGLLETATNEALRINLGGAVQVSGHLSYVEVE